MKLLNDPAPWWGMQRGPALSIVDLIENGTITADVAAAVWWALERGASVFVAAGPQRAGKTTLASALLAFLPDDAVLYVTAGRRDPLALPPDTGPVYLLVNELSDHTPVYLAGPAARRAFELLHEGHRMIGTLHADSAAEAVAVMRDQSGIPPADIAGITLVAVLRAWRTAIGIARRVVEVGLLRSAGAAVEVAEVVVWDGRNGRIGLGPPPEGLAALASWAGVTMDEAERMVDARAGFLDRLVRDRVRDFDAVRGAVLEFRRAGEGSHASA